MFDRENVGFSFEREDLTERVTRLEARGYYNYVDHVMDNYSLRDFTPTATMPGKSVQNPDRRTTGGRAGARPRAGARGHRDGRRRPAAERALAARDDEPGHAPLPADGARRRRVVPQRRLLRRVEPADRRARARHRRPARGPLGRPGRTRDAAVRHDGRSQPDGRRRARDDADQRLRAPRARPRRTARDDLRGARPRAALPRLLGTGLGRQGERRQPERLRHGAGEDDAVRHRRRVVQRTHRRVAGRVLQRRRRLHPDRDGLPEGAAPRSP